MSTLARRAARRSFRQRVDKIFHTLFLIAIAIALIVLVMLLSDILQSGLKHLNWNFLTGFSSRRATQAGILAPLIGSFWVITLTALFAIPIGIATAVYLEFYASDTWLNRILQTNIANLAGVPSIVYGLLGLAVFVRYLGFDRSILSASLTLALLILPVVIVNTQEAIKSVPRTLSEGVKTVVLPSAMGGILTGTILSLSRAFGETAPLITVGAWAFITYLPRSPLDSFTVMPVQIWVWASKPQEAFRELAATTIIVLLMVLLTLNAVAVLLRNRYQKRAEW
jgi:phosphate transport system permease protein